MDISQKIQKLYEQTGISPEVHDFGEKIEKSLDISLSDDYDIVI